MESENGDNSVGTSACVALRRTRVRHARLVDRRCRRVHRLDHRIRHGPGRGSWWEGALVPLVTGGGDGHSCQTPRNEARSKVGAMQKGKSHEKGVERARRGWLD